MAPTSTGRANVDRRLAGVTVAPAGHRDTLTRVIGLIVLSGAVAALGAIAGRRLAARGITAENALKGRQVGAYLVLVAAGGATALLYYAPKIPGLPATPVLYAEAAVWPVVQAFAALALGFLIGLEWSGRRDRRRLVTMVAGAAVLALAVGFLFYRSLPLERSLGAPRSVDGVVMQTTSYTCAPAAIATIVRALRGDTTVTESTVVALAGTSRSGTTALAEIRAMRRLGLAPRFARSLAPESLAAAGRYALLHVNEPVVTTTVRHAVALLAVDTRNRTITIGNPLYGRQVKPWSALRDYWLGEAVFVDAAGARLTSP